MTIVRTPNISGSHDPKVAVLPLDPDVQIYQRVLTIVMNYDDFKVLPNLSTLYDGSVAWSSPSSPINESCHVSMRHVVQSSHTTCTSATSHVTYK